jgi:hypothetical protein
VALIITSESKIFAPKPDVDSFDVLCLAFQRQPVSSRHRCHSQVCACRAHRVALAISSDAFIWARHIKLMLGQP